MNPPINLPIIILVRPQLGENIGAVARIMKNFGFSELRIVRPRDGWPNAQADAVACKGIDIITQAKISDNLASVTTDIQLLYATSARSRNMIKPSSTPREAASAVKAKRNIIKSAIMFGPENSGLSNAELALTDSIIYINASPDFQSINLAQSAAIICYEISQTYGDNGIASETLQKTSPRNLATKHDVGLLYEHLETELENRGFFCPTERKPAMIKNIRAIFSRNQLTKQEVGALRGIIHCLAEKHSKSDQ
ncbi:tRNA (cytidine/uridine-2'-O-)-methyltransferase TrmJ [Rickettsiales bacterium]|nr:tRNA (cytidine/uridine-2'-O-)-methyltransferase TrmJ [Rickettsiales bacterium]